MSHHFSFFCFGYSEDFGEPDGGVATGIEVPAEVVGAVFPVDDLTSLVAVLGLFRLHRLSLLFLSIIFPLMCLRALKRCLLCRGLVSTASWGCCRWNSSFSVPMDGATPGTGSTRGECGKRQWTQGRRGCGVNSRIHVSDHFLAALVNSESSVELAERHVLPRCPQGECLPTLWCAAKVVGSGGGPWSIFALTERSVTARGLPEMMLLVFSCPFRPVPVFSFAGFLVHVVAFGFVVMLFFACCGASIRKLQGRHFRPVLSSYLFTKLDICVCFLD